MFRRWHDVSFQSKLLLIFFLLGLIPSVSIGTIAYFKSVNTLEERLTTDLDVITRQLNAAIERVVEDVDRFSIFPYFTPEIFRILNQPYVPREQWGYQEIDTEQKFAELLATYPSIFSTIEGLIFYSASGNTYGYRVSNRSSINERVSPEKEEWYQEAIRSNGGVVISSLRTETQFNSAPFPTITAARMLVDEDFRPAGVMVIDIRPEFIDKIVRSVRLENMHVIVTDKDGQLIYSSSPVGADQLSALRGVKAEEDRLSRGWLTLEAAGTELEKSGVWAHSSYLGWTSYVLVERNELLKEANEIRDFTVTLVVILVILASLVSILLARRLSKPIRGLIRSMRLVERGLFAAPNVTTGRDEIGQLYISYVRMVGRLDKLVHSIEVKEEQKREAELNALRARITPHFLYNTIHSIRMLAELQQADRIARLLKSLNKLLHANMKLDRDKVTLEAETDFLRNYVRLMELRYANRFKVNWRIEVGAFKALVPPMILQPLVENAIFHGSKGKDVVLNIEVGAECDKAKRQLLLWVIDDGRGVEPDKLDGMNGEAAENAEGEQSIGLYNVRDRIRFRYGASYGVKVRSEIGQGTQVYINLPYEEEHEEQR
ncbi:cache domain-containing sensor histidine kinase [Cohnella hongkongensis]|uniref:Sensor histidine kinase n=1 Tax=Cohnella hongkongensis TaxID=178337 RepID=A0ABV9FA10_9BACL